MSARTKDLLQRAHEIRREEVNTSTGVLWLMLDLAKLCDEQAIQIEALRNELEAQRRRFIRLSDEVGTMRLRPK